MAALQNVFDSADVPITVEEARRSMGIAKKSHIREILAIDRVNRAWRRQHSFPPQESDVNRLYADFQPKQMECLTQVSGILPGVPAVFEHLRRAGVKIGSTTGYTRPMLDFLVARAREQGSAPDLALSPDDVSGGGRPLPYMCYSAAIHLQAFPLSQMVKVGDTPSDIGEGLNAGMWTIGITRTGNEAGLTEDGMGCSVRLRARCRAASRCSKAAKCRGSRHC